MVRQQAADADSVNIQVRIHVSYYYNEFIYIFEKWSSEPKHGWCMGAINSQMQDIFESGEILHVRWK